MGLISWVKPSGLEIETNDLPATIKDCEGMGWKQKGATSKDEPQVSEETVEISEADIPEGLPMSDPEPEKEKQTLEPGDVGSLEDVMDPPDAA